MAGAEHRDEMNTQVHGRVGEPTVAYGLLKVGRVLQGTYRIVRPLAEGGCGEVYVAAHTRLGCEVAVKILHRSLVGDPQALARFRQEAEITAALRHPHIVQIFDFNLTEQGVPYLVMELLAGQPLSARMTLGKPFEPRAALHIVAQIAQALQVAHASGVVHRDLKPDNVILVSVDGRDDFVKVVDFGISQASWRARLTGEPIVAGTPQYMAPEQACGLRDEIDHRADQFSLAAIAHKLLTGREPFDGDDAVAVLYQVVHEAPQPPSALAPWLGAGVDEVIGRGMSKGASDRYPSITAFAEALAEAIEAAAAPPLRKAPQPVVELAIAPPAVGRARVAAPEPPGSVTMRLIRRTRPRIRGRRTGSILLTLAAAGAFAWFSPATRDETRDAWRRVTADAHRVVEAAAPRGAHESLRSVGAAIP
jgi:serine/threonine-protein kinase